MQNSNSTSLPVVGILGGGQLSDMMMQAYQELGGRVSIYATAAEEPALALADTSMLGGLNDRPQLLAFFKSVDVVTLENEFFDADLLISVAEETGTAVLPDPKAFKQIENKVSENQFFQKLGVPVADFFVVENESELPDRPGYLKLSKGGYDGIGTLRVANKEEASKAYKDFSQVGEVLYEQEINCAAELSLIAVSNADSLVFYPLVETIQEQGTCRYVLYPAQISPELETQAQAMVAKVMQALDTSGLFAFELFLTADGELLMNESAPRPHNSGHITMDSMDCSQFENHMRAVAGMALREPAPVKPSATMVNLLATRAGLFDPASVTDKINDAELKIYLYGKQQLRNKRKMGHVNLWGADQRQRADNLLQDIDI